MARLTCSGFSANAKRHALLVGIGGAADQQQRRIYRKLKSFFWSELYRRTRELSISFLFDETSEDLDNHRRIFDGGNGP
jgi:hypothetical protein